MSDVIKLRYMLEISIYPNGASYQKIFPIGNTKVDRDENNKKRTNKAEKEKQTLIKEQEIVFDKKQEQEELF